MKESFPNTPNEDSVPDPSRRSFIKKALALGAAAAVGLEVTGAADRIKGAYEETFDREQPEQDITNLRERLRSERGIELDFSPIFPQET